MSCSTDIQLFPMAVKLRFILTKRFKLAKVTYTTVLFDISLSFFIITARKRSCGKVMFLQVSVILSTGRGVCLSACWETPPARETPLQEKPTSARRPPCQGDPPAKETPLPGRLPCPPSRPISKGKLRGIRSRPTPKGEIEGDHIQAHTRGGNSGGSGLGQHSRGKFRGPGPPQ